MTKVTLIDGPYEGLELEMERSGAGLYVVGDLPDGTPIEGREAYYRPTRKRTEYRFKGWIGDEEIIRVPVPGKAAA
ncbi:MAG TPA: hypothetical protein VMS60_15770 [Solirubrobacterales bacterium]|nr:hypothetical protein [Solirubrobacterales bacterium]